MADNVTIQPVLHYRDPEKALRFLVDAFGVEEKAVHRDPDGNAAYVEAALGDCWFGFGRTAEGDSLFDLGPTAAHATDSTSRRCALCSPEPPCSAPSPSTTTGQPLCTAPAATTARRCAS